MKKFLICALALILCLSCLVACDNKEKETESETSASTTEDGLTSAYKYLYTTYKDRAENTPSDYTLIGIVTINGVVYDVEWTASVTSGSADGVKIVPAEDGKTVTVDVDEKTATDIVYTLKAVIKDADGNTQEVTFQRKVPEYKELSWAEYIAAKTDAVVVVKGVVTALMSKSRGNSSNCIYMQDNDGGYYVYGMATDPIVDDGIEIGMTIRVTGTKALYSGTYEITGASVEILEGDATVSSADYTEIYQNATDLKDKALTEKQSTLVTLRGVEITGQDTSYGYYKFKLGDLETYVRISSSVCPLTKEEQTTLIAGHTEHLGYIANVTGIICIYDGAFYLTPVSVDAFEYVGLPQKSDEEAVAYEKENLTVNGTILKDSVINLPVVGQSYGEQVSITWALDQEYAFATVVDGKLTIELPEEETTIKLTATLTAGESSETKEFELYVDAAPTALYIPKVNADVAEGTYKFVLFQNTIGKVLYFDGTVNSSEYLATTEKAENAADVVITAVEGGYTLKVGEQYLEVYKNEGNKIRVRLVDEATGVWVWNEEVKVFTFTVEDKVYYLGTYRDFTTFSASEITYISGDNAEKIDVSQFPGKFCTVVVAEYRVDTLTAPAEGIYKFILRQNTIGKVLYFDGTVNSSEYLATTEKAENAADVVITAVEGGYTLKVGEQYLEVYKNEGNKIRVRLVDEATGVWVWNEEVKVFTFTVEDKDYYLGTYRDFTTFSASEITYISGDNAEKIDVSQFPGYLVTLTLTEVADVTITEPEEGTYKFVLHQNTIGKVLYFDGTVNSSEYLATTEKYEKAADVVVAAVEGGYTLKVGEQYLEVYKNEGNKIRVRLVDEATGAWVWNEEVKVFTFTVEDKDYYLGTYRDFTTFSASEITYISGDNAEKIGVSQFPGELTSRQFVD